MEPHPEGRGRPRGCGARPRSSCPLQWSRIPKDAEGSEEAKAVEASAYPLQWSRIPKDAEGRSDIRSRSRRSGSFNGAASRRTRKAAQTQACSSRSSGFNGAASRRTRKDRRASRSSCACPRGFNGAASRRTRKVCRSPRRGDRLRGGFNGAASRRTRKGARLRPAGRRAGLASMEPHPEGRGRAGS